MFNETVVAQLKELATLIRQKSVPVDEYLRRQREIANSLADAHEDIVDVAYDHEDPLLAIEALEIIALDRDPSCKVVLRDLMLAHSDPDVQTCARRLLSNVAVLETAKAYLKE
jgi:hypothetical protein